MIRNRFFIYLGDALTSLFQNYTLGLFTFGSDLAGLPYDHRMPLMC